MHSWMDAEVLKAPVCLHFLCQIEGRRQQVVKLCREYRSPGEIPFHLITHLIWKAKWFFHFGLWLLSQNLNSLCHKSFVLSFHLAQL
jgi:hypothetical protein